VSNLLGKYISRELNSKGNIEIKIEISDKGSKQYVESLATDTIYEIEIEKKREKRSLDANAYCWTLCQKIAEKIGSTKEEVYRHAIHEVGQFEILSVKDEAVDMFITAWESKGTRKEKGIGWICEIFGASDEDGYTNLIAYYGSSVYDSKQMSILVNYIVEYCKENDIPTLDDIKLRQMIQDWENR
jgi:hypothetical protein